MTSQPGISSVTVNNQLQYYITKKIFLQKPKKPSQFLDDGLSLGGVLNGETSSKAPYEDEDPDFVPDNDDRFRISGTGSQGPIL